MKSATIVVFGLFAFLSSVQAMPLDTIDEWSREDFLLYSTFNEQENWSNGSPTEQPQRFTTKDLMDRGGPENEGEFIDFDSLDRDDALRFSTFDEGEEDGELKR